MSRRGLVIVVGTIVALLLAAPFAIGMITENGLRQQLEIYDQNPTVVTRVENYERSWFSSQARLNIRLGEDYLALMEAQLPARGADPAAEMIRNFSVPVIVDISHGPLILKDGLALGTSQIKAYVDPEWESAQLVQQLLGVPYLFEFRGRGGFGTGFRFEGEIPPFDNAFDDISYEFSGLDFSGVIHDRDTAFEAQIESASLQSPAQSLLLEQAAFDGDYDYREGMVTLSNGAVSIGSLAASNPLLGAAPIFSLEELSGEFTISDSDDTTHVDTQIIYRIANLAAFDAFSISDAALGITLQHIDATAVLDLQNLISALPSGADQEQMLAIMMPIFDRIVAGNPTVSFDPVQFSMPEGSLTAAANFSIDPAALPSGQIADLMNPLFAMLAVNADLDLSVSKALVQALGPLVVGPQPGTQTGPDGEPMPPEQIAAMADAQLGLMLTALAAQGLIVDDGETYSTSIQFANGAATANGQPIPLGGF